MCLKARLREIEADALESRLGIQKSGEEDEEDEKAPTTMRISGAQKQTHVLIAHSQQGEQFYIDRAQREDQFMESSYSARVIRFLSMIGGITSEGTVRDRDGFVTCKDNSQPDMLFSCPVLSPDVMDHVSPA
jgi:hypothetical protein